MKKTSFPRLFATACISVFLSLNVAVFAQNDCSVSVIHDEGYTSTISSVVDNGDDSFTITLVVESDGCSDCKSINRYSIQATPGTYSDITVEALTGDFSFSDIVLGPQVRCFPLQGFGIVGVNGLGNGDAGSFSITYTLSGGLQEQVVQPRAFLSPMPLTFTLEDFQAVLDCENPDDPIIPYYPPPEDGKTFDIIGSELSSLYTVFINSGEYNSDDIFQIVGSNVIISISTQDGKYLEALELLTTDDYGLTNPIGNESNNVITGLYPIDNLLLLNELPVLLISASPVYSPITNIGFFTSQGDTAMRSFRAREVFGLDGAGTKVGVLSDSYNTQLDNPAAADVLRKDLPGSSNPDYPDSVDVLFDYPFLGGASDEGRAMMQIIHDIAPGASLAFRTGFLGPVDFAAGILALEQADCDIIVDDITYINAPFFRDGIVAQAVDAVNAAGASYFSAAGNFGNESWEGDFNPTAAPEGIEGEAHNFSDDEGADIYQEVTLDSGDYTLVMQWDDGTQDYDDTNSDFDIYLVNQSGEILFGFNRVNTGDTPIEVLPFRVEENNTIANLLIVRASGSEPALLKYIVFRGDVQINEYASPGASTIVGQANAAGAIAVGAVDYANFPEFGGSPVIETFSSLGGTPVNGVDRMKPEISGPNRVDTSVDLVGGMSATEGPFTFAGTSAAAPHAAGLAALILEARQKFFDDTFSPTQIKNLLQSAALDIGEPGFDSASGSGLILADSTLGELANPAPFLTGLSYDTTLVPGIDTLELTIFGEYLKAGAEIYLNGYPVDVETNLVNSTTLLTTIPPQEEPFPIVRVFNQPKEGTNGNDGGLSNSLSFISKQTILVQIDDAEKPFGVGFPEFNASYGVIENGTLLPLDSADLSQAEIDRILSIELTTVANTLSNVGLWGIEPSSDDPLNPDGDTEPTDTLDISLLERFDFVFVDGVLTVNPLDLIITPRDTTFMYNDSIVDLSFDYFFSTDPESEFIISESDSLAITSALRSTHETTVPSRSAIVRGTALVNEFGEPLLNAGLLQNKGFFVTTDVRQSRGTALVNGELIDPEIFFDAILLEPSTDVSSRVSRGTALVNTFRLVRGTALVNTVDSNGTVIETTELSDPSSLTNSTGFLSPSFIDEESNSETITILGESDISILSGDSVGVVETIPTNLVTGNTVGEHFSLPGAFLTNNFNVQYGVGIVTILPDTLNISIDESSLSQTYDGSPKAITVTVMPDTISFQITYDGDTLPPVNAGQYEVEVSVLDTNFVGSATATFTVEKVIASVSTGIFLIDEGDELPDFTAEFDGFINEDDESVVASVIFEVQDYEGSAGVYDIIPIAQAENYSFEPEPGLLYVNPAGEGTASIKIKFICFELLEEPLEDGSNYIATYGYRNLNQNIVYIPHGENNFLSGNPNDDSNLPIEFLPGDHLFTVPFQGSEPLFSSPLSWTVTSNAAVGTDTRSAAVTNIFCDDSAKSGSNGGTGGKGESENKDELNSSKNLSVYPNPTSGRVMVILNDVASELKTIEVFDLSGRKHHFEIVSGSARQTELNVEGLSEGLYILRIEKSDGLFESINLILRP